MITVKENTIAGLSEALLDAERDHAALSRQLDALNFEVTNLRRRVDEKEATCSRLRARIADERSKP
jgi:uncharacterized coiled-coil protein SlyX